MDSACGGTDIKTRNRCQIDLLNSQEQKAVFFQSNLMKDYELVLTGTASDATSRWRGITMTAVSKFEGARANGSRTQRLHCTGAMTEMLSILSSISHSAGA